ncbi:9402_t:CDS:2 [Entrophospora sp. SA101]|nr:8806_t:CDS:2 [Entrophospora sp. SA101]CAJ0756812.1 9030_t:CDS:2 [Entrophospora sp. SA101]CAJ0766144.1 9402_t:CDS:2 [Entrophospora sp. SA101]CAJ0846043.1 21366_t:CDS:2 [Entrophospora sp. SA101]CAJ0846068.1 21376_t:CDS:2 [Entrophospora sp. SA101]
MITNNNNSITPPFVPSEQSQRLIDSYTEVTKASMDQMNEISKRAQLLQNMANNIINETAANDNPTSDFQQQQFNSPVDYGHHQSSSSSIRLSSSHPIGSNNASNISISENPNNDLFNNNSVNNDIGDYSSASSSNNNSHFEKMFSL